MQQGNDVGTTYRSTIYAYTQEQLDQALCSKDEYQKVSLNHPFVSLSSIHKQPSGDPFVDQWFKTSLASEFQILHWTSSAKSKNVLKNIIGCLESIIDIIVSWISALFIVYMNNNSNNLYIAWKI